MRCAAQPSCCCAQQSFAAALFTTYGFITYMLNNVKDHCSGTHQPTSSRPSSSSESSPPAAPSPLLPLGPPLDSSRVGMAFGSWLARKPTFHLRHTRSSTKRVVDPAMPSSQCSARAQHSVGPPAPATLRCAALHSCCCRNGMTHSCSPGRHRPPLTRWAPRSPAAPVCTRTGPRCQTPSTWPAVPVGAMVAG